MVWNVADLHLHTTYSDGSCTPIELLEHAAQLGLRVIAVTDHDEIEGAFEARKLASSFGVEVVIGEEISTAHGHLLGLFLHRHIPPGMSAEETVARIHEQGGLAIAPHPFDASVPSVGRRLTSESLQSMAFDGIEVFNAGIFWPWRVSNHTAQRLAETMQAAQIGGSDAHALCAVGSGRTWFRGHHADDLFAAIRNRNTRAEGAYLTSNTHVRQTIEVIRSMGIGSFTRWVIRAAKSSKRTAAI